MLDNNKLFSFHTQSASYNVGALCLMPQFVTEQSQHRCFKPYDAVYYHGPVCIYICVFKFKTTVWCALIFVYLCLEPWCGVHLYLCIYNFAFIFVYLYLQPRHGVRYELPAFASIRCRSTPWPLLLIRLHPYIIKLLDKQTKCNLLSGIIMSYSIYIY